MDKSLFLRAVKHNWGMMTEGDWEEIEWLIYSDRSYQINVRYCLSTQDSIYTAKVGKIREKTFSRLTEITEKPWIDPNVVSDGCDGEAWQFQQFSEDGEIEKSTGNLGYIFGQEALEHIISLLPGQSSIPYSCPDPDLYKYKIKFSKP